MDVREIVLPFTSMALRLGRCLGPKLPGQGKQRVLPLFEGNPAEVLCLHVNCQMRKIVITAGDADDWKEWLQDRCASAAIGRATKFGKQFFGYAKRKHLILENPFEDVTAPPQVNESRKFFVSRADAQGVLEAWPATEWRLIVALSRYGGLRCPFEIVALLWQDVDWERGRFWVSSPKTEGHGWRWVPLLPELRPYFEAAFEEAPEGAAGGP
jgi:integrase